METADEVHLGLAAATNCPKAPIAPIAPLPANPPWRQARHDGEALPWSVVALTLLVAVSTAWSAHQGNAARPKELLPVVITTAAR